MKTRFALFLPALLLALLLPMSSKAMAASRSHRAAIERQFSHWLRNDFWPKAHEAGISARTYKAAFAKTRLNWSLPDLLPPGTPRKKAKPPRQSEFRSPGRYFKARHLNYNISQGRAQLKKWRRTLDKIERRYGVPREIIVSIWGKETAFGRAKLPYRAVDVLATQAFMGRRKALFEAELLAALTILQQGHISPARMKSAWAGALGHPQFMPTAFLKYAVDFDADGHKNIWTSVPDALASIAYFLQQNGWNKSRNWGVEVSLPNTVSCTLEGPEQGKKTEQWRYYGIKRTDGRPFAHHTLEQDSFLLLPAGRYGPTFLVSNNFYVLKSYNESDVYALLIGHVADRMKTGGNGGFRHNWRPIESFSRAAVRAAQLRLEKRGIDVGGADGLVGFKTRIAIGSWQKASKGPGRASCYPDRATLSSIR